MKQITTLNIYILLLVFSYVSAEPIISYETDPIHIYSNLNNSWWQDRPVANYNSNGVSTEFDYEKKIEDKQILNSNLTANINNIDWGRGQYARIEGQNSWHFVSTKKIAPNSRLTPVTSKLKSAGKSDEREYRGISSDSDITGSTIGGFYTGLLFRHKGDDDIGYRYKNSTSYIYVPVIPPDNPGDPVNPDIPVAPAPGSILLGAIGVALVGFLRNKKVKALL